MPARKRRESSSAISSQTKRARLEDDPVTTASGRPKRTSVVDATPAGAIPRKRGRPPKTSSSTPVAATPVKSSRRGRPPSKTSGSRPTSTTTPVETTALLAKKRGRPPTKPLSELGPASTVKKPITKAGQSAAKVASKTDRDNHVLLSGEAGEDGDSHQYWLMKAEPNDRFEKGHNVKFSIDDLAVAAEPEPWDGVRNPVARNNMRAMRKGDLAFFYHSNCKTPAIVGIMRIVQEHSVDQSAFDPNHPYYDSKSSKEAPKWDVVHVQLVKKFDQQITLKMMQDNAATTGELANMQVLRLQRLSVTSVRPHQWQHVLKMAGEDSHVGEIQSTDNSIVQVNATDQGEPESSGDGTVVVTKEDVNGGSGDNVNDRISDRDADSGVDQGL